MIQDAEEAARRLYDACSTPKPSWDQLGDVTKEVWLSRVASGMRASSGVGRTADCAGETIEGELGVQGQASGAPVGFEDCNAACGADAKSEVQMGLF